MEGFPKLKKQESLEPKDGQESGFVFRHHTRDSIVVEHGDFQVPFYKTSDGVVAGRPMRTDVSCLGPEGVVVPPALLSQMQKRAEEMLSHDIDIAKRPLVINPSTISHKVHFIRKGERVRRAEIALNKRKLRAQKRIERNKSKTPESGKLFDL